jgi:hypothetical protein
MKMIRRISVLLTAFLLGGLLVCSCGEGPITEEERLHRWFEDDFMEILWDRFSVVVSGGASSNWDEFRYTIQTKCLCSVDEMRELLISVVSAIEGEVNSNPEIESYLPAKPIPIERFLVNVSAYSAYAQHRSDKIAYVIMWDGRVNYFRIERDDEPPGLYKVHSETWEDALAGGGISLCETDEEARHRKDRADQPGIGGLDWYGIDQMVIELDTRYPEYEE